MKRIAIAAVAVAGILQLSSCSQPPMRGAVPQGAPDGPQYVVDPFWPKPLQDNWIFGQVTSVAVDRRDHVWVLHRPLTLLADEKGAQQTPPTNRCCVPAPAVMEFDPEGNYVQGWGGPGEGYDWPKQEHGIHVDWQGNVWIAGNDPADHHILKFTRDGRFLLQIGKPGKSEGSNSRTQLGRPAAIDSDQAANEIYVSDGYGNRRVIVFDATTGAYKRHWGAYGGVPSDEKLPPYKSGAAPIKQFRNAVHCVRISRDGQVYVCDRGGRRIQVFRKDGTYVKEFLAEAHAGSGDTADLVLSPDPSERYAYVADGLNVGVAIFRREDGRKLGSFGRPGRMAGEFRGIHNIAIDSKGNIYTAEVGFGRRLQKFQLQ